MLRRFELGGQPVQLRAPYVPVSVLVEFDAIHRIEKQQAPRRVAREQ
jgi:hypothetical protein